MCKLKEGDRVVWIEDGVFKKGVINAISVEKSVAIVSTDNSRKKLYTKDLAKAEEPTEEQEDELETQEALVTFGDLKNIIAEAGDELSTKMIEVSPDLAMVVAIVSAFIMNRTLDKLFSTTEE